MATMSSLVINGVMPPGQLSLEEVVEFDKILKLRDDIFSGIHPRLTVPAHLARKVSPASASSSAHFSSDLSDSLVSLKRNRRKNRKEKRYRGRRKKTLEKIFLSSLFSLCKTLDETLGPSMHKNSCPKKAHILSYFSHSPRYFS